MYLAIRTGSPLNPNRIRNELPFGIVNGFSARYRHGSTQGSLEPIDGTLFRSYFDDPDGASVIVICSAYCLIGGDLQLGPIVEDGGRREKDEREDRDTNYIVCPGPPFKRP
jgi:hypothetical protein